jgi:hypothetical protein
MIWVGDAVPIGQVPEQLSIDRIQISRQFRDISPAMTGKGKSNKTAVIMALVN